MSLWVTSCCMWPTYTARHWHCSGARLFCVKHSVFTVCSLLVWIWCSSVHSPKMCLNLDMFCVTGESSLLWRQAEDVGLVKLGEETALGRIHCGLPVLPPGANTQETVSLFTWIDSDRTRDNGFNCKGGRYGSDIRGEFFTQRAVRHCHRLPIKQRVPHPWRFWRLGWMGPGAAWAAGEQPTHSRGWGWVDYKASSYPTHSMIPRFYNEL